MDALLSATFGKEHESADISSCAARTHVSFVYAVEIAENGTYHFRNALAKACCDDGLSDQQEYFSTCHPPTRAGGLLADRGSVRQAMLFRSHWLDASREQGGGARHHDGWPDGSPMYEELGKNKVCRLSFFCFFHHAKNVKM